MKKTSLFICLVLMAGCASANSLKNRSDDELYNFKWYPQSQKQKYRQELVRRHPEWDEAVKANVLAGKIEIGMTKNQVLSSVGKPAEILGRTPSEEDSHAVWIYRKKHLEFDGEKLIAIYQKRDSTNEIKS